MENFEIKILNEDVNHHIDYEVYEVLNWTEPYMTGSIKFDGKMNIQFEGSLFGRRELDQHILLLNELYALAAKTITNWDDRY